MTKEKRDKFDLHFLSLALLTSYNLSKDPASKAGCAVVTEDTEQISLGFNGFIEDMDESPPKWERPIKYSYVIHAEPNACSLAHFNTKGCTAYVSWQPCIDCMKILLTHGITRLVYYGYHPRYENGAWNRTDQDLWLEFAQMFKEITVVPKNELLEGIRNLFPKLEE